MSKQELMKLQTCVLRVNIHCDGCKKKVKQLLQKVEGVYSVAIDAEQGKVTVTGLADPNALLRKLEKAGKHGELWGPAKGMPNQNKMEFDNQMLMNMQHLAGGKPGNLENKSRNNSGNKGGNQHQQMQQLQQQQQLMKNIKDMKMGSKKEQKAVKFNIPEEDSSDGSLHDLDDEFGDDDHSFEEEFGHGMKGNKEGKQKDQKKGSSGGKKKGGFFDSIPFLKKKMGTKSEMKHGNGGGAGGKSKGGGGNKDGGKNVGFPVDFGKVGDFGEVMAKKKGGNGNGNGNHGAKQGEAKNNHGSQLHNKSEVSFNPHQALSHPKGGGGGGGNRGSEGGFTGPMVPAMGQYPMGQMGSMPGMGGGGYYQNPYQQNPYQQQYMGMMMNQHHQQQQQQQHHGYGYDMYQPTMYAQQPHPAGYVPPMPPPASNPYIHTFNDENADSCSIM